MRTELIHITQTSLFLIRHEIPLENGQFAQIGNHESLPGGNIENVGKWWAEAEVGEHISKVRNEISSMVCDSEYKLLAAQGDV